MADTRLGVEIAIRTTGIDAAKSTAELLSRVARNASSAAAANTNAAAVTTRAGAAAAAASARMGAAASAAAGAAERAAVRRALAAERAAAAELRAQNQLSAAWHADQYRRRDAVRRARREGATLAGRDTSDSFLTGHGFATRSRQLLGVARDVSVAGMGAAMAVRGAAAMAGGLFRPMLQLETTMAELAVKGGLNRAQSSDVERVVRSVGKSSGFGAVAAGQAGVELAAAGITGVSDLSSAIPTTLRLARADKSLGGTGAAASTLVQTASQFGLTATAFESIGDKMVKAADSSTVSVRDLSESLTEIGAVSHGAGISLEETLGTLALLGKAGGIEGSKAGTGLKAVVSNLVKPTRQTLGGLASVGITEKQAQNALQDLPAFFKMLNDKMDARKMTAAQRAKVMFTIFKQEGASAANTLSQNTEAWRQMTREVSGADGQLATVSEALESTTEGALMRFRAAVDDAKISLADRLAPTLTRTLPDATRIATGAIGLIGDNLTAISVIGGTVGAAWSVSMLASAGTALATGFTAIGGSATMLTAATAAGTTFGATFAASMMAAVAGYAGVTALLGVTEDAQGNNAMHRLGARYSDLFAGRESAPVATHRGLTAGAPGAVDPMTSDLPGMSAGAGYSEEQRATIFVRVDDDGKPRLRTESRGKVALKLGANPGGIGKFE